MSKFDTWTPRAAPGLLRYGLAPLSVAAALALRQLLRVYFDPIPNSLFFCAIVLSSWYGGVGPGTLAALLSVALIDFHPTLPLNALKPSAENVPRLAVFVLSAVSIAWLSGKQRRTEDSLREARDQLELKVRERTEELERTNRELRAENAERKSAEEALLSSEARLKHAQAVARLGSFEVDVPTGQTRWSDEVFHILGLDPARATLSRREFVERVIHPEDRAYAEERYERAVREGEIYNLECRIVRADGAVRFVQSMGEAIRGADGAVVKLIGAILDITERKQIEDNLARLNRTLQTLYQCNQALIHAAEERQLLEAVCRILVEVGGLRMAWVGYRQLDDGKTIAPMARAGHDEGYVESIRATWADGDRGQGPTGTAIRTGRVTWTRDIRTDPSFAPWRDQALARGYCSNLSLPLRRDGETFGALTLYAQEPNAFNERTVGQFSELADNLAYGVTALRTRQERARAQQELEKQTAYLDELFDLAPEAIVLRDVSYKIIRVNQEFTRIFGYSAEEAIGRASAELITPDELRPQSRKYGELLARGERVEAETVRRRKDGTTVQVSFVAAPVSVAGGQIAIYAIYRDITEKKKAEESLREAQAELTHVNRVMTMGELAASIAHEVNQPLAAVVTNANACLRWIGGAAPNLDEARQAIERIVRDGNRASEVIGRIRALVKKSGAEKTALDVNEVVRETVGLTRSELEKNGAAVRLELAADLPRVIGDRVQLQQVILNLVLNGAEAMSAVAGRARELTIRTRRVDIDKVLVAVQDSGIGLQPDTLDHLFRAFFTTKPKGMGMGLAISRSIVENHGGRLWAEPNGAAPGAIFQFTLPAAS